MPVAPNFSAPDLTTSGVLQRVKTQHHWNDNQATNAERWYQRFLELTWANGGNPIYTMHKDADLVWHEHLKDPQYAAYCLQIFGQELQHVPDPTPDAAKIAAGLALYTAKGWHIPQTDATTWCHS